MMNNIILSIRQFFCNHNIIRYWDKEEVRDHIGTYRVYKASCMKCGLDYEIKERIK